MLRKLLKSESGVTTIEFALIALLVAVVALPALGPIGDELQTQFSMADSAISGTAVAGGDSGSASGNNGNGKGGGNNGNGKGNGGANL